MIWARLKELLIIFLISVLGFAIQSTAGEPRDGDAEDSHAWFYPQFLFAICFLICFLHSYSYHSDLPFKIRSQGGGDWFSSRNFQCVLIVPPSFCGKSSLKNPWKKLHDRRDVDLRILQPGLSLGTAFLAPFDCKGLSWHRISPLFDRLFYPVSQYNPRNEPGPSR